MDKYSFLNKMCTSNNCCIYSDEPYEFEIIRGTPDGKITMPNAPICLPCSVKKVLIAQSSVLIKESKIKSIKEIQKDNQKFLKVEISYKVAFIIKLLDSYNKSFKIKCYLDKYPMPDKETFFKSFIRVYSIVDTTIFVECKNCSCISDECNLNVNLYSRACINKITLKKCKEKRYICFYDVNCEEYIKLIVRINLYIIIACSATTTQYKAVRKKLLLN